MRPLVREFVGAVKAVKIELRRPASGVACAGGFVSGLAFFPGERLSVPMAVECVVGGLLAVAALGELPYGILDVARRRPGEAVLWASARSLFPLAGVVTASVVAGVGQGHEGSRLAVLVLAILATACTQGFVHVGGLHGSEPATAALLVAVGAAAAASTNLSSYWLMAGWVAAAWTVGRIARNTNSREGPTCSRGRGRTVWLWPLPAQGRLRPLVTALSMVIGLVSMAAWLVPQPPMANRYTAVAAGLFIALAVPQMTLADGIVDRRGWSAVLQPVGASIRTGMCWPPAGRIAFAHMAMFAWPLVVAGVLTVRLPGAAVAVASALAALLLLATVAAALAVPMQRSGGSAETTQAAMLAVFAACYAWCGPQIAEFLDVFRV